MKPIEKAVKGIRIEHREDRPSPYRVIWRDSTGQRRSKSFKKLSEAKILSRRILALKQTHGKEILKFDPHEWQAWLRFKEELADFNPDLTPRDLLGQHKQHHQSGPLGNIRTKELVSEFLDASQLRWERQQISRDRLTHLRKNLSRFLDSFEGIFFNQIIHEDIAEWLDELGEFYKPVTLNNHLRDVKALYFWAIKQQKVLTNPAALVESVFVPHVETPPMPPGEAERLLRHCATHSTGLGRLACEMFVGLRYASASRLQKVDIKFEDRGILLPAAKLKTGIRSGKRHYITGLPNALWEWLKLTPEKCWDMTPRQYLDWKSKAFSATDIPHPKNILRHTAATYLLYDSQDPPKVSAILCHRDSTLLWDTYKGNSTEREAKAYMALTPEKVLN